MMGTPGREETVRNLVTRLPSRASQGCGDIDTRGPGAERLHLNYCIPLLEHACIR